MKKDELLVILEEAVPANNGGNLQILIQSITELTTEIRNLKTAFADNQEATRKQFEDIKKQIEKQNEIIAKQQQYLERQDSKARECNLVVLGVPEDSEALDGATTDCQKVDKVWGAAGITCVVRSMRRLGQQRHDKRRPILVEVHSKFERDSALDKAKKLKEVEQYKKIYVKKDQHPSVRLEWRLHTVFQTEKERPCNRGCNIDFNFRERKIYKDQVVIDQWNLMFF